MSTQVEQFESAGGPQWISDTVAAGRDNAASVFSRIEGDERPEAGSDRPVGAAARPEPANALPIPQCW